MRALTIAASLCAAASLAVASGIATADADDATPAPTASASPSASAPATAAPTASASASPSLLGPTTGTSVACPVAPAALSAAQSAEVLQVAARRLASAAVGSSRRYPFGALTNQTSYARTGPAAWTSGFYPGELWLMVQATQDDRWLRRARSYSAALIPVANDRSTHDLGFMVGVPMSLATDLEPGPGRRRSYLNAEITAAKTLGLRFNPRVGAIKSSVYEGKWGVIVDSAMNAPMLIEVGQALGPEGDLLVEQGTTHMLTLARTFVRSNGSTFHRMAFNPRTGALIGPVAGQGLASTSSTWSRGQAWAINGFTRAYALTGDARLLQAAEATANYWLARVPPGCVPAWDLDVSNDRAPRDSSAAAIAADGLLALAAIEPSADAAATYRTYAQLTLGTLASPGWLNTASANPGILLRQSLNVPANPRDGSYVWGDYYLLHAVTSVLAERPTPSGSPTSTPVPTASQTPGATPAATPGGTAAATPKPSPTD
ncbi:MAG: hypothetical protein PHU75_08510 [Candidatus Nanopelagicales bacterium]|nr:hypothetical protein [Candidatus Nanopelagicales bacterium]